MTHSAMSIDLAVGEVLTVGDVRVTLEHKSGRNARLTINAPRETPITRPVRKKTSAQECASSPEAGKEHTNGKHPV